jgi:hypothetical protein
MSQFRQNLPAIILAARGLSGCTDEETDWRQKCERLKHEDTGCSASGAYALGPFLTFIGDRYVLDGLSNADLRFKEI